MGGRPGRPYLAQRMRVMAAADLLAALYGIGQSAWPARLLAQRGALKAVTESIFRSAPEAFSALLARTRREDAGAWAVVAPRRSVHAARSVGWCLSVVADPFWSGRAAPSALRRPYGGLSSAPVSP